MAETLVLSAAIAVCAIVAFVALGLPHREPWKSFGCLIFSPAITILFILLGVLFMRLGLGTISWWIAVTGTLVVTIGIAVFWARRHRMREGN
jgi:hypothetical protein